MNLFSRYDDSVAFLAGQGEDWARLIDLVGPCRHDPKAAREPYEALVRAIAYQQLTAKAGDAIIGRLKGSSRTGISPPRTISSQPGSMHYGPAAFQPARSAPSRPLHRERWTA